MTGMLIPNFRGRRALVLHPRDRNRAAIVEQLERLGLFVSIRWPAEAVRAEAVDVVFFDSDTGFDGLFAWKSGDAAMPLVAALGSEAPGRIEWTINQRPSAYLAKPVGSTGVFSALSIAYHDFALRRAEAEERAALVRRLEIRDVVVAAAAALVQRCGADPAVAVRLLRRESMRRRCPIEVVSALVLAGRWLPPELVASRAKVRA
jgi:AmiR/NasT family two-component response regulator